MQPAIVIIELGSQYALVIQRALRELGYRSVVLEPERARLWIDSNPVKAVILSGGHASVYDKDAPEPPRNVFKAEKRGGGFAPVLGICYGMQYIAHFYQGRVARKPLNAKYSKIRIKQLEEPTGHKQPLFLGTPMVQDVWASHSDEILQVPDGFEVRARTEDTWTIEAIASTKINVYGVQFHPEVSHTEYGKQILENFVGGICGCEKDWQATSVAERIRTDITKALPNGRAIFGFSGGVDSTTLGALAAPILGDRLLAITIDGGNLRQGELREIRRHARAAGVIHKVVNAQKDFLETLKGCTDAQEKRRRFQKVYGRILIEEAIAFGGKDSPAAIIQGTLAPDRIESGSTGGNEIKRHHNVGIDFGAIAQLHPLEDLFKYEVRALAEELGLPKSVFARQPFPGPGNFVRVVGGRVTATKLKAVQWAEREIRKILISRRVYKKLSQLVVAYVDTPFVGVKGDKRVYKGFIAVRGVQTTDFMTAKGFAFPERTQEEICAVLGVHPMITHVGFFPMNKPPATTEFE